MEDEQIRNAIHSAIRKLVAENPLLEFGIVHERSTAHRLAVQMEPEFGGWNVDCEYDRDGHIRKVLDGVRECRTARRTDDIIPDIIVHHRLRRGREHNLLVVELKKDAALDPCDDVKLGLMTRPEGEYQYQLGLYINIDGGTFACTWYKDGARLQ